MVSRSRPSAKTSSIASKVVEQRSRIVGRVGRPALRRLDAQQLQPRQLERQRLQGRQHVVNGGRRLITPRVQRPRVLYLRFALAIPRR